MGETVRQVLGSGDAGQPFQAMPLAKGLDVAEFAKKTDGYTGADIENICREAGMSGVSPSSRVTGRVWAGRSNKP